MSIERLSKALEGRYTIERELGAGGMATVYLAHDVRHNRKVAVKVLRPELAAIIGGERFLKEIEVTANLQHPNILPLYDSGSADSFLYFVMPYIAGESLRAKLTRERQLGVEESLGIARGVASALHYAHQRGVIHRDIKPANILLQSGQALVADFGIALAVSAAGGTRLTETGLSLGTPHYMSPEQATGERELDARSDVYALGCVLYEMLAGDPPHTGSTVQQVIAKIVTDRPRDLSELRDTVPPHVAAAVTTALSKLPADRFATAEAFGAALGDVRYSVSTAARPVVGPARTSLWKGIALTGIAASVMFGALAVWSLTRPIEPRLLRFKMLLEEEQALAYAGTFLTLPRIAITPDGNTVVYTGGGSFGASVGDFRLMARPIDALDSRVVAGTEAGYAPEVSPEGDQLAFVVTNRGRWTLKLASLVGGPPITLVDSGLGSPASWGPDGYLYFLDQSGLSMRRVPSSGGPVEQVVTVAPFSNGATFHWPHVLPNGRGAIATLATWVGAGGGGRSDANRLQEYELHVIDFASGETHPVATGIYGIYCPTGHLLYVAVDGVLMAEPFDQNKLEVTGRPVSLIEGLDWRNNSTADLAVSQTGTLIYTTRGFNAPERIVWAGRDGRLEPVDTGWTGDLEFEGLALSPDGRRLAVELVTAGRSDIWIKQMDRGPLSRLTFEGADNTRPAWTPDGRSVMYLSLANAGVPQLWRRRADGSGSPEPVLKVDREIFEAAWSRDSSWMILSVDGVGSDDIWAWRPGTDSAPRPILTGPADEYEAGLSPDGRWLAYVSEESGTPEVFVRPFPSVEDGKWQISASGGMEPLWSRDGRELYFRTTAGRSVMVAGMTAGPSAADPRLLFQVPEGGLYEVNPRNRLYEVNASGTRFLLSHQTGEGDLSGDLVFVQNFFSELRAKMK